MIVKRGDMFYADLSPVIGSEQGGIRPVLIIQNDMGNKYSPTVIAAAITSQTGKNKLPTHIELGSKSCGLKEDSVVLAEQIRTIDKINSALGVSFGLEEWTLGELWGRSLKFISELMADNLSFYVKKWY